jgi:hypothetical protein
MLQEGIFNKNEREESNLLARFPEYGPCERWSLLRTTHGAEEGEKVVTDGRPNYRTRKKAEGKANQIQIRLQILKNRK